MKRNIELIENTTCNICNKPAKYRCPGCDRTTCSLLCSQQHKEIENCNGKRSKIHHIPVEEFSLNDLISDYEFLEDGSREVDNSARMPIFPLSKPKFLQNLQKKASERGVDLKVMPKGMTKRETNTTYYNSKKDTIYWKVEFLLVDEDFNFDFTTNLKEAIFYKFDCRFDENFTFDQVLKNHFTKTFISYQNQYKEKKNNNNNNRNQNFFMTEKIYSKLQKFEKENNFKILLLKQKINNIVNNDDIQKINDNNNKENDEEEDDENEEIQEQQKLQFLEKLETINQQEPKGLYFDIKSNSTLKDCLKDKTVVEYVTCFVLTERKWQKEHLYTKNKFNVIL